MRKPVDCRFDSHANYEFAMRPRAAGNAWQPLDAIRVSHRGREWAGLEKVRIRVAGDPSAQREQEEGTR